MRERNTAAAERFDSGPPEEALHWYEVSQRAKLTRRPRHPERRHRPRKPVAVEQSVVIKAGEVFEVRLERLG